MSIERRFITIRETSIYLSLSKKSVYEKCLRGEIPSIKIGRSRRVDLKKLEEKLANQGEV